MCLQILQEAFEKVYKVQSEIVDLYCGCVQRGFIFCDFQSDICGVLGGIDIQHIHMLFP